MRMKKTFQEEIETLKEENKSLKQDNQDLQAVNLEKHSLAKEINSLRQQLLRVENEAAAFGIDSWKISRDQLKQGQIIGGGGWGAVTEGQLRVAVKQFYPTILSPQNVARMKREMEMLARIRHPNLVQFVGVVFEEKDNYFEHPPYIVTELLDISLRAAYEQKQIPQGNLCSIFQDVARALDYLHQRHEPIIHRDVSSANVLLKRLPTRKWMAKVSDLGSANLAREAFTKNEGAVIYCAPEAFTDDRDTRSLEKLSPKADVYSYGVMLCEVATSTLPEKGVFDSLLDRVKREWPSLHEMIIICIAQKPENRPSMKQVLSALVRRD